MDQLSPEKIISALLDPQGGTGYDILFHVLFTWL